MVETESFAKLELELRRGAVVLATLSQLSARGMEIEEGTLYPLLRRLESQGLLTSEWKIEESGPPRRYYVLNPNGRELYAKLVKAWRGLSAVMDSLIEEGGGK